MVPRALKYFTKTGPVDVCVVKVKTYNLLGHMFSRPFIAFVIWGWYNLWEKDLAPIRLVLKKIKRKWDTVGFGTKENVKKWNWGMDSENYNSLWYLTLTFKTYKGEIN